MSTGGPPAHHVHTASARASAACAAAVVAGWPGASVDSRSAQQYRLGRCLQARDGPPRRGGEPVAVDGRWGRGERGRGEVVGEGPGARTGAQPDRGGDGLGGGRCRNLGAQDAVRSGRSGDGQVQGDAGGLDAVEGPSSSKSVSVTVCIAPTSGLPSLVVDVQRFRSATVTRWPAAAPPGPRRSSARAPQRGAAGSCPASRRRHTLTTGPTMGPTTAPVAPTTAGQESVMWSNPLSTGVSS